MISLAISAYSDLLKFDMKMFVNIARLDICQLFTQSVRRGHPCTLDTFLVFLFVLRFNVPVNNFSVMLGRSHRFLDN